jgi:pimeloyl-ACP methyl ester carboxylesterase
VALPEESQNSSPSARLQRVPDCRRVRKSSFTHCNGHETPLTLTEEAAILERPRNHEGAARTHVVSRSYGGPVAPRLAHEHPERAGVVALFEPAALGVSKSAALASTLQSAIDAHRSGDVAGALDGGVCDQPMMTAPTRSRIHS